MGSTGSEWVWQVIDRVGAKADGRPNADAAVLGNLLERIKTQTTRLGNKSQPGTAHNAIIRVPSPHTLRRPLKPKPMRRSLSGKSSPPRATGALGNAATVPGHLLDPGRPHCAADLHGSASSTVFAQRPTLAASTASALAPMAVPAEAAHTRGVGADMAAGRHYKVPPVSISTSARPSSVKQSSRPQPTPAQTPRLNIELNPPLSPRPSPHVSDQAKQTSFTGTLPHADASSRASFNADSRIHAPTSSAQIPNARLLHSTSSMCTSNASRAPYHAQSSLAHHPGRTGRPLHERSQLSIKIPQGSVAASHSSQQSSPATPQDESKRPLQERVVNQDDWLAWCSGGPLPPGVLDTSTCKDVASSSTGHTRRLSFMESRKEALRLDRMATRVRSSMRVRPLQTHSHQGHAMDGLRDVPPQQQTRQLYHSAAPDSCLPSESSAASVAQDLPASSPPSPSSYSHLQLEQQQQRPRSATRLSNLGIQAAFNSFSSPDPKLPALDEDSLLPQSSSTLLQESSQTSTSQDPESPSHSKIPEPMEQGVPLSWLHSACADGQYRDAHVLGNQVVQGMGHELQRALEESDGEDTPNAGGASHGRDRPGTRYAAIQRRIAELHQDKMGVQRGSDEPTGTATAGTTGTAPASAEQAPPLVSWAAACRPGLQAHYNAAMERARQRLERQAAVSKATLGLGSSFTAPNTPLSQVCQPSTTCHATPFGTRGLKHGRGASMVSFAGRESISSRQCLGGSAHDPAEDSGLTSPANSSVASTAGAPRLEGNQSVDPTPHHHHHQGPGVDLHHYHQQQQQQQGGLHHQEFSKSSIGGQSSGGLGQRHSVHVTPATAVPDAVLQQSQEAAAINAALQLLDAYSQLSLEMYGQDGGAAAITKVRSAIEAETMDIPDPLHPEVFSVFLSSRKQLRRPVPPPEFPSGAAWSYLAAAGSRSHNGFAAIEGSVRDMHKKMKVMVDQRGQSHGLTATPALLAIEQSLDVQALSTVRALRHQAHSGLHSLTSWDPVGLSSRPPLATLPESATIAQAALRRVHLADQSSDQHSSNAGPPEVLCHETPLRGLVGSLPANPRAKESHGDRACPPYDSPRGVCSPTGVYTVSSTAPPMPDPEKQGPVLEGLWWWLEDLMVEMHGCESMRLREFEVEKTSASTPQVAHKEVQSPRPSSRRRSRPSSPLRGLAGMLQFDATKPTWQAKAHASKMAELAAAANAMRAAGSKFTDPECLPRILYFMIHLTASIEQGRVPWKDAGFLLCAGLELLLGEMEWLASQVHLAQGSNSPHLRVLHAVLTAFECQVDYSTRLSQYAADVRAQLEKAHERALVAEDALQAAEGRAQADHSLAASLHMQCRELQGDNKELKANIAALQERLALQADADHLPS